MRMMIVRIALAVIVKMIVVATGALLRVLVRVLVRVRVLVTCVRRSGQAHDHGSGLCPDRDWLFSVASPVHSADTGTAQIFSSSCSTIAPL